MRFLQWLKSSPVWLIVFPLVVAALLVSVAAHYQPLVFDPSLYPAQEAYAKDLKTIDTDELEGAKGADGAADAEAAAVANAAALGQTGLTDGTYTGYAVCGQGNGDNWKPYYVAVTITVRDGKVASIDNIYGSSTASAGSAALSWDASENQRYLDQASGSVWPQMEGQLSSAGAVSGVDMVSGATYSSAAIYNAYMNAVSQAGGSGSSVAVPSSSSGSAAGDSGSSKRVEGDDSVSAKKLANGTWTGYAVCGKGNDEGWKPYYVAVTVKVKNGKATTSIKVKGTSKGEKGKAKLNWDQAENGAYLNWAANGRVRGGVEYEGVLEQIKAAFSKGKNPQSIDTVSGATYSSEAIFDALYAALKKSAKAAGLTIKDPEKTKPSKDDSAGDTGDEPSDNPADNPSEDTGDGGEDNPTDNPGGNTDPVNPGGENTDPVDPAEENQGGLVDGTYSGHAFCKDLDDPKAWSPYYIIVEVTVKGGKIVSVSDVRGDTTGEIDPRYRYDSSENSTYLNFAINGVGKRVKGMKAKIQAKLDAGQPVEGIDTVSSATWSSTAILEAYAAAAANAEATAS